MSRTHFMTAAAAIAAIGFGATAAIAGDASTIRVEPRPFYGATVTLEAGVRVFRPLPPQKYVVINPDNRTPLNLSLSEVNKTSHNYNENHNYNHGGDNSGYAAGGYPVYGNFGSRSHRGQRKGGHGAHGGSRGGYAGGGRSGGHGGGHGGGYSR